MTGPIWMAAPPEVHSVLLSSGPGPGPLLASAGAWNALSVEYASVAEELSATLASVQAGAWEGPSAESYVAANVPYLVWLMRASANSAATAAQQETVAAAYTAALAAMPTLPELAANHTVHGALLATNFFGINTIPIALNEADYVRMWIQAATTMSTYQVVASAAVASTPQTDPAPAIVKSNAQTLPPWQWPNPFSGDNPLGLPKWLQEILRLFGIGNELVAHDPKVHGPIDYAIAQLLRTFGIIWNPAHGTLNGFEYDLYTNPATVQFWIARALELFEDFQQFFTYLQQNPFFAFQYLVSLELFDWPLHIEEIVSFAITQPELLVPAVITIAAPFGGAGVLAGLAGLAGIHPAVAAPVPVAAAPPLVLPVLGSTPIAAPAVAPTSAPAPAPTPAASTVAGPAPPPAPPAPAGPGFAPPYVVGPPIGLAARMSTGAASSAKRKAPEPDAAAAAAAAGAKEAAREKRRRRARMRGHADEFMDMNVEVDPEWGTPAGGWSAASDLGAENLGFAGAARKETAAGVAGLTTLAGDEFGSGPRTPMVPGTWDPNEPA